MISALDQPPPDDESDVATLREPMLLRRKRGRPLEMTQSEVLARIRQIAATANGLFRIHHTHSDLYARARRQFGSWAAAVGAAGVDYLGAVNTARTRATETRRERLRSRTRRT
ncbi:MAG: hypothetical protein HY076_09130 [Candidatus Eisenbacteria bacterium]|uniref:Uncharacterized protein n=1 Tax=Eiseniibacteriota bacterium TaxID=2212470 RepID=A0A9D6L898_UNCEI|nr:hypothetical protein [Candidatus Eisenbacteria bacterium]MBI3540421.1 hypothetical protein [Candidatus Eisenbacteria bacterium]